jgi:hypothetical protein
MLFNFPLKGIITKSFSSFCLVADCEWRFSRTNTVSQEKQQKFSTRPQASPRMFGNMAATRPGHSGQKNLYALPIKCKQEVSFVTYYILIGNFI